MAKTTETLALEQALEERSRKKREYGCTEVTIGFKSKGHGDEIVDYLSMDADGRFRCYELKVSLSDLKSDNHLSWYGDYNYLVVSEKLYLHQVDFDQYIPPYVGILVGEDLVTKRNAHEKQVNDEDLDMLKDSLLRSIYWKMTQYKDAGDLSCLREKDKEIEQLQKELDAYKEKTDRMVWTYQDYEHWYAISHDLPSFSLEEGAKREMNMSLARERGLLKWQKKEGGYCCPVCHNITGRETPYCPICGIHLSTDE